MLALTSISAQTKVNKPPNPLSTQSPPFQAHPLCIPFSSPAIPPNQPARTVAFLCHQLREPTRLLSALFHHHPANLQLPPLFILPISPAFVASTNRQRGSTRRIACHFPSFTWTPRPPIVFSFGSPFKSFARVWLAALESAAAASSSNLPTSFNKHHSPATMAAEIRRKLVIVGDGACGKTCLLM